MRVLVLGEKIDSHRILAFSSANEVDQTANDKCNNLP